MSFLKRSADPSHDCTAPLSTCKRRLIKFTMMMMVVVMMMMMMMRAV